MHSRGDSVSPDSDDALMAKVSAGDRAAFAALLGRHGSAVFGYCLRILGGRRAAAEDVTQEVWMKVIANSRKYAAGGKFEAWLFRIARNESISELRKDRRLVMDADAEAEAVDADTAESELLELSEASELKAAIDSLSHVQRAALVLRVYEGLSYGEIATSLDTNEGAVKSLIFRAKQVLKAKLGAAG